jgi:uncharacterized Zn finger protein
MIKETKVDTFVEELYCDKCGTEMEQTGIVLTTDPPRYPYRCPKCGYEIVTNAYYPRTVTKVVEDENS